MDILPCDAIANYATKIPSVRPFVTLVNGVETAKHIKLSLGLHFYHHRFLVSNALPARIVETAEPGTRQPRRHSSLRFGDSAEQTSAPAKMLATTYTVVHTAMCVSRITF